MVLWKTRFRERKTWVTQRLKTMCNINNGSTRSTKIWICEIYIECLLCIYRNPKTRNWFRYEIFYYLFEFEVFRHEERETKFLSMLTFPSEPQHVRPPPQTTGLASASSENRLPSSNVESQLQLTQPTCGVRSAQRPLASPRSESQLTHALTNPCTKRKVLSLTKPKGKLYKTKNDNINKNPFRHYITHELLRRKVILL